MAIRMFEQSVKEQVQAKVARGLHSAGEAVVSTAVPITPIDTGNLRRSERVEPLVGAFRIGSVQFVLVKAGGVNNVGYALYLELGTRFMAARPYLLPALRQVAPRIPAMLRAA